MFKKRSGNIQESQPNQLRISYLEKHANGFHSWGDKNPEISFLGFFLLFSCGASPFLH